MRRVCIDLSGMNPFYRGGVNTYIYGLVYGFFEIKTNYKINIVCTDKIYKSLKHFKKKILNLLKYHHQVGSIHFF